MQAWKLNAVYQITYAAILPVVISYVFIWALVI